jgi:hypothetical protein
MIVLNIILMVVVSAAILGLLLWSILTQHRDPGCEHLRVVHRRVHISVRLVPLDAPAQIASGVNSPSTPRF